MGVADGTRTLVRRSNRRLCIKRKLPLICYFGRREAPFLSSRGGVIRVPGDGEGPHGSRGKLCRQAGRWLVPSIAIILLRSLQCGISDHQIR
jgi:hypothetical protein